MTSLIRDSMEFIIIFDIPPKFNFSSSSRYSSRVVFRRTTGRLQYSTVLTVSIHQPNLQRTNRKEWVPLLVGNHAHTYCERYCLYQHTRSYFPQSGMVAKENTMSITYSRVRPLLMLFWIL